MEGYQPGWLVPGGPVVGAEILLFAVIEAARLQHFTKFGPGAKAFDPAGLSERPDARLKEIKNGRLASAHARASCSHTRPLAPPLPRAVADRTLLPQCSRSSGSPARRPCAAWARSRA